MLTNLYTLFILYLQFKDELDICSLFVRQRRALVRAKEGVTFHNHFRLFNNNFGTTVEAVSQAKSKLRKGGA